MVAGIPLGYFLLDEVQAVNNTLKAGRTNLLLAAGLGLMVYPPLAQVKLELLLKAFTEAKVLSTSMVLAHRPGPARP